MMKGVEDGENEKQDVANVCAKSSRCVCIFGLSGDPPTGSGGHMGIVSFISAMIKKDGNFIFDEVLVLPVYRHMFSLKRNNQTNFDDRLEMCRLNCDGIPRVVVSPLEKEIFEEISKGKDDVEKKICRVGTVDVLSALKAKEPNTKFTIALGTDTFMDLTGGKWRQWEDVISHVRGRILVIQREVPGDAEASLSRKAAQSHTDVEVNNRIQKINEEWSKPSKEQLADDIEIHPAIPVKIPSLSAVSSTAVRLTRNMNILKPLLKPSVLEYIRSKQLYAFSEDLECIYKS